jgi:hypothetical protein
MRKTIYIVTILDTSPNMNNALCEVVRVRAISYNDVRRKVALYLEGIGEEYQIGTIIPQTRIQDLPE